MRQQLFVEFEDGARVEAELVEDRERNRILRVPPGEYAVIVKESRRCRIDPLQGGRTGMWLQRNRSSWHLLRKCSHPGIVQVGARVVDSFGDEGFLCQGLRNYHLQASDHPARRSLRHFLNCAIQLTRAAGVIHREGFVHGDITPANVCFSGVGLPVLIDFEMAVPLGRPIRLYEDEESSNMICATPACCSPEHVQGFPSEEATDIFCISLTLLSWISGYFGVAGDRSSESAGLSMRRCARGDYPHWRIIKSRLREDVCDILKMALHPLPQARYKSADQLSDQFERLADRLPNHLLDRPIDDQSILEDDTFDYVNITSIVSCL